jgi:hypothetical protein
LVEGEPAQLVTPSSDTDALLATMATKGCPVCKHLSDAIFTFFAQWQYELSTDEQAQRTFADDLGFCPLHTWQLADLSSIQGIATGYPKLLDRLSRDFGSLAAMSQDAPRSLAALTDRVKACRACAVVREAEQKHIACFATCLADPSGRQAYAASQGVCLRHLDLLVQAASNPEVVRFLLSEASRHFERWAEDMQSYAIKRDALRSGLLHCEEEEAYLLALLHLAGNRNLCLPRAGDYLQKAVGRALRRFISPLIQW